jgi:hypothetical protein
MLRFVIRCTTDGDWVGINWSESLGRIDNPRYLLLSDLLEAIPGVESVEMRRYSADVRVARHVTLPAVVASLIRDEVFADDELTAALLKVFPEGYQVSLDVVDLGVKKSCGCGKCRST